VCVIHGIAEDGFAYSVGGFIPRHERKQRMVLSMVMHKTTVYLPADLKAQLERTAAEAGRPVAELIREGIRLAIAQQAPAPTLPILVSADPHIAEHADEHLRGLGER
jgi:hypothetical protein